MKPAIKNPFKGWSTHRKARWLGYGLTFLVLFAWMANMLEGSRLRSLDFLFWLRGPVPATAPVVIVAIDAESFNEMPMKWTWPRSAHARLIRQIMKGKPKAIVFDMTFTEEDTERPQEDAELAAACRASGCVVMAAEIVHELDQNYEREELNMPIRALRNVIAGYGLANTPQESDAFIRRGQLFRKVHDERHYSLALEGMRRYLGIGKGEINFESGVLEFGDKKIPLDAEDKMWINYCGPAKTFKTIPYYQVWKGMTPPEEFKDQIVFVGATAAILHDVFPTPFSWDLFGETVGAAQMPGVEIHANVVDTVLNDRYIKDAPDGVVPVLIVALGMLIARVAISARLWIVALTGVGAAFGVLVVSVILFSSQSIFLDIVHPVYAIGFTFIGCTVYRAAVEMREKQKVKGTFARYVSPNVLTTVLNHPPELGGTRREATMLFSDVRGFTSMSEKLTAHEVVEILNEYLTQMVDVVLVHDGTLDKFVGDAVMAVYGSPMDQTDAPLRAVSTAWYMHLRHELLKEKWVRDGKVPFEIGIGVNTGEVVAGNMGSPSRMEFTVIGDNVNLAARLESATKEAGTKILISGATLSHVKDFVTVKELPPIHMKGKAEAVTVFALLGIDEEKVRAKFKLAPDVGALNLINAVEGA